MSSVGKQRASTGGSDAGPAPPDPDSIRDPDDGTGEVDVSENALFEVLANRRRRYAIHMIERDGGPIELGAMAERIAAWENDQRLAEVTSTERKRVYTALQQLHLPKMDEVGVVEFDKDRGTVEPTEALSEVDVYAEIVRGSDIPWSEYYLGLSAVGAAVMAGIWVGAWPFAALPDVAWGAFVVVAFAVSAIAHQYDTRGMRLGDGERPPGLG